MEKKLISVHAVTIHIYTICIAFLLLLLVVLGAKYLHLKLSVQKYTQSTIWMNQQDKPTGQISEYALIVAKASQHIPALDLQNYVTALSKELSRDIVVMDSSQKILADTVVTNKGTFYTADKNSEIKMTIEDGQTRFFEEKSTDYPNGIIEVVVPTKNASGQVVGAVLISNSQTSK